MEINDSIWKQHGYFLRIFFTLPLLLISLNSHAGLVLTFDTVKLTVKPDQKQAVKPEKGQLVLEIGNKYLRFTEDNHEFFYDFNRKRIISLDLKAKTYQDDSLYMDLGFRGYEFQNRLHLGRALSAANVKDNPMAITINEHGLSLKAKDHSSGIKKKNTKNIVSYSWTGKELFKYSNKQVAVKSNYVRDFVRFVRYHLGGHPEILNELQSQTGIPISLTMKRYNVATTTTTLTLASHHIKPDTKLDLSGYKKAGMNGELANLVPKGTIFNKSVLRKSADALLLSANNSFNKKHYLDTVLAYLEYTLVTGEQMPAAFAEQRDTIVRDQDVNRLFKSFSPKSKEEAQKLVNALVDLRNKTSKRKHVLKIFEANNRSSLGQHKEAMNLFHDAIKANSFITGAWKDLGELYFRQYNSRAAWRCWDIARKLNPDHHLLESIYEYEQRLEKTNPEFF